MIEDSRLPVEILRRARATIKRGWCQESNGKDANGRPVGRPSRYNARQMLRRCGIASRRSWRGRYTEN